MLAEEKVPSCQFRWRAQVRDHETTLHYCSDAVLGFFHAGSRHSCRSGAACLGLSEDDYITGKTPLHIASWNGNLEVVKTLLAAKVEMDKIDNDGKTPLDKASSNGHLEVVTTLLA